MSGKIKKRIAGSMFGKGSAFLDAHEKLEAFLITYLKEPYVSFEPTKSVSLYLLCQGTEVLLKGLLLMKDYEKFYPLLKPSRKNTNSLGHDLLKIAKAAQLAYNLNPIRNGLEDELTGLNKFYNEEQKLRYGHLSDVFVSVFSIEHGALKRRMRAVIRLAVKHLVNQPA